KIKIATPISASVDNVELPKNSNISHCVVFDDLPCAPSTFTVTRGPAHGTYQVQNGNCIKYFPYYNYVGLDTLTVIACDTCNAGYCDTVYVVFETKEPTAIKEESKLIVFAMFPNPTSDKLIVQYYLYEASNVSFKVFDVNGRLISTDEYYQTDMGLKYAQLNTTVLAAGTYVVEVKAGANTYRKQIIKQ
ncbi:MAG: T9SS type A sorting domain-containing protein, partial [Bacteroidetes bacterium]|nr:T9SS type A sorting domain-containing protein [Bacteroidota bacterium]